MFTYWQRLRHWLGWGCGMKLFKKDGEVLVEINCRICAKAVLEPAAYERAFGASQPSTVAASLQPAIARAFTKEQPPPSRDNIQAG